MSANDVALLMGVPVSEQGFSNAWEKGSEYLRGAYTDRAIGWASYSSTARLAAALCRECQELGAKVVLDATLADLATQAAECQVVVLITHMQFPMVRQEDLRDGRALFERVYQGQELEWELLGSILPARAEAADLINAINYLLVETQRKLEANPVEDLRDAQASARHRHTGFGLLRFDRPRLDELCGEDILAPASGIELSGSMITAQQFVSAFPREYDGFVDLRMCNSISVGAALRRARPRARVAISKRQVRMDASLILLKAALACMAQCRVSQRSSQSPLTYEASMRLVIEAAR